MPSGKTHVQIGAIVMAVVLFLVHQFQDQIPFVTTQLTSIDWILLSVIVYLYSQLPNINTNISVINNIWNTSAGLIGLYCLYTRQHITFGIFAVVSIVALEWIKYKGVTHTIPFIAIMAAPLWVINPLFSIVAFTTAFSHLVADREIFN